ncbi:DUF6541 family protein [Patescibacteria group bacterium]
MSFIFQQILFFVSIILLLFIPGYFIILAIWGKSKVFSLLEKLVISFGLSIIIIDFLLILIGKIGIAINTLSLLLLITVFSGACIWIYKRRFKKETTEKENKKMLFSKDQIILIVLILFLTVFIKTIYLSDTIFPTSTDLGHHMFWSKQISETGELPTYEKQQIVETDGNYNISQPQPIADFIIGEHLIFSAINMLSGISFISYFPSLVLFLINIMGIMAVFILSIRLFENFRQGKNIAILTLFLIGPLFAISSSQAKFVSGGVIGNILGNLLIPLSLYFYLRALRKKDPWLLATGIFLTFGLFYTHHLSAFIFIYIFAFIAAFFLTLNAKNILAYLRSWLKIVISPPVIATLILAVVFLALIYTPSYIKTSAVETAIGSPSKSTRTGLTFSQLKFAVGEMRMAFGIIGLVLILTLRTRKTYSSAILSGWLVALLIMSLKPHWLYLDIPSGRIANYAPFPLAIAAAFAFVKIVTYLKNFKSKNFNLNSRIIFSLFILMITFAAFSGFYDNSQSLSSKANFEKAVQTFHASIYLAENIEENDVVLKDHNYIIADAWMKLFYMRDYNYPFSRSFFKRYEDETKKREMCTLWMVSTPNTSDGQKCFSGTKVNFIMVNPTYDGTQFEKTQQFWKTYSGDEINIYYRNL